MLDVGAEGFGVLEEAGEEENGYWDHCAFVRRTPRKLPTAAICGSTMSEGTWPQSANSTSSAPGFTLSIVSATDTGKTSERSPRISNTGQRTRYHASHMKIPGESGSGCAIRAMRGSKWRR